MTLRSIYTAMKIKPTTAENLRSVSGFCALMALPVVFDFYRAPHWSYAHGISNQDNSKTFRESLNSIYPYGPDLPLAPVFVVYLRLMLQLLFWGGSIIIMAAYSSKADRVSDANRLVGFLFLGTICLDVTMTFMAAGQGYLLFTGWFGSVRETLTTLIIFSVLAFLLFPRRKAKQ